jgi:hypothetical protein
VVLTPEVRHQLYRMLRLCVVIQSNANIEVSGVFGEGVTPSNGELVPRYESQNTESPALRFWAILNNGAREVRLESVATGCTLLRMK